MRLRHDAARFIRENDWPIAAAMTACGLLLAAAMVRIDHAVNIQPQPDRFWLYGGGADGAAGVLSAIAGSMVTVAGVIFSAYFVAMQLASSQYTPRVIRALTRRRPLQFVLGTFLGTFIYALMVLRTVRERSSDTEAFVPVLSVSLAVVMAIASVGVLIYFFHFAARTVQPVSLIAAAAGDALREMSEHLAKTARPNGHAVAIPDPEGLGAGSPVVANRAGYIQSLDPDCLLDLARRHDLTIHLQQHVGAFVLNGEELATIWPIAARTDEVVEAVRLAFHLGDMRTPEQDIEFGFRQVADIALKALSPAINDPTTAMTCIDSLAEMTTVLAQRSIPTCLISDDDAAPHARIFWTDGLFERCVDIAFAQIRHYGAHDSMVMAHLLRMLRRVVELSPPNRRPMLIQEARLARQDGLRALTAVDERARVELAGQWIDGADSAAVHPFWTSAEDVAAASVSQSGLS